jgi:hypothetical protein
MKEAANSAAPAAELGHSPFQNSWRLKLNLMVLADCEPTSASRIQPSREFIVELSRVEHLVKSRYRYEH